MDFESFKKLFDTDNLGEITQSTEGLLWLKVKSLSRGVLLDACYAHFNMPLVKGNAQKFSHLFKVLIEQPFDSHQKLDSFIKEHTVLLSVETENELVSELYRMQYFDWGGDYKNALDKHLIDTYVKTYGSYDGIHRMLETDIPRAVYGYILCSWYNHWSTILIENLFKKHEKVLPALGNIKKVDFFLDNIPFDLKVTYLPANYIELHRKQAGLKSEISTLKTIAKQLKIPFSDGGRSKDTYAEIVARLKDCRAIEAQQVLQEMYAFRKNLALQSAKNPKNLIQNLYEEQGEMRFDASNRLFLILVDTIDVDASWKLKRNVELLTEAITTYVTNFRRTDLANKKVTFTHKAKSGTLTAFSDAIFVLR